MKLACRILAISLLFFLSRAYAEDVADHPIGTPRQMFSWHTWMGAMFRDLSISIDTGFVHSTPGQQGARLLASVSRIKGNRVSAFWLRV